MKQPPQWAVNVTERLKQALSQLEFGCGSTSCVIRHPVYSMKPIAHTGPCRCSRREMADWLTGIALDALTDP